MCLSNFLSSSSHGNNATDYTQQKQIGIELAKYYSGGNKEGEIKSVVKIKQYFDNFF